MLSMELAQVYSKKSTESYNKEKSLSLDLLLGCEEDIDINDSLPVRCEVFKLIG
jgi:hypothetical protein